MLIISFQISNIPQTIVNNREIELHDTKRYYKKYNGHIIRNANRHYIRINICRSLQ